MQTCLCCIEYVLTLVLWLLESIPKPLDIRFHQFSLVPADASRWRLLVSVVERRLFSHSNRRIRDLCPTRSVGPFPLTSSDCGNTPFGSGFCCGLCRRVVICARLHGCVCGSSVLGPGIGCWSGCVCVSSGSPSLNASRLAQALLHYNDVFDSLILFCQKGRIGYVLLVMSQFTKNEPS